MSHSTLKELLCCLVLVCVTGHAAAGEDSQFVTGPDHAEYPRCHVKIGTHGKMGTPGPQFLYIL